MTGNHFQNIEQLEASLWEAADQLRANSKLTSSEYCMPVLGIIFLRHATNRYNTAVAQIEADQAAKRMPKRPLIQADFLKRRALMLPQTARYDEIRKLPKDAKLGTALVEAMDAIEKSFEPLVNQLPKDYEKFENDLLENILRIFDSETLRTATGDVFGRIYEYFLMKFAMQGAQDNGEFFTPPSLVQTIVNVIEPVHGVVADLACGSGGMFVQTSHFIESHGKDTTHRVTFFGQEKTATTIRLAKMNLAVHGLEGDIREANTFYDDVHRLADGKPLWGNCDYMMANPPFNVDMVDADKVKDDRRLPFGLPGVNKGKKVSNANYLWISYFHSYLGPKGRAGFVMSSQASSAGHGETEVRRKIVETGHVDVMISIRSNFFYTRSVPCELWFFDKAKPTERKDSVLMLDARNVYRKVTRKIFDFSAEQQQNLSAVVWLYRGQNERFIGLVGQHVDRSLQAAHACFLDEDAADGPCEPLEDCLRALKSLDEKATPFVKSLGKLTADHAPFTDYLAAEPKLKQAVEAFRQFTADAQKHRNECGDAWSDTKDFIEHILAPHADRSRSLASELDALCKHAARLISHCEADNRSSESDLWNSREIKKAFKAADAARLQAVENLKRVAYFHRQALWLLHRFPEARYVDVPGLCKIASRADIAAADWSLTPGRYVGVAQAEVDEDFDFGQAMRDIHVELKDLDREASELAAKIQANFEGLGI